MTRLALLHSTIRKEEKLIIESSIKKGVEVNLIDLREIILDPVRFEVNFDLALERSVSTVKGNYAISFFESLGVPVLNSLKVATICQDKFLTSMCLLKAGVPTPKFALAFDLEKAIEAVDYLGGFPVIIKPPLGSWGRLLAKINDLDALEAIFEHKDLLGGPQHKALYMQEYVEKNGHDIRAFVIGPEVICAVYRISEHWITNTARGAKTENCLLSDELVEIAGQAAQAVGGGLLALDIFETEDGFKVNEVNHTMEFRNSEGPTGVSISSAIVDYCLRYLKENRFKNNS
ncbi:MAG: lysine biosynthesis protein LysX [Acidobacteriota bacterium]|nr:lysine biosynthesis protein LysX [Acidobacteriota bacterium]